MNAPLSWADLRMWKILCGVMWVLVRSIFSGMPPVRSTAASLAKPQVKVWYEPYLTAKAIKAINTYCKVRYMYEECQYAVPFSVCLFDEGAPELVLVPGAEVDEAVVPGGQPVVDDHLVPLAEAPEVEPEKAHVARVEPLILGHDALQRLLVVGQAGQGRQEPRVVDLALDEVELVGGATARVAAAELVAALQDLVRPEPDDLVLALQDADALGVVLRVLPCQRLVGGSEERVLVEPTPADAGLPDALVVLQVLLAHVKGRLEQALASHTHQLGL